MKRGLILGATACWTIFSTAQASPIKPEAVCVAKVVQSEELPYAQVGYWLVRVTLRVTPLDGRQFLTTLQQTVSRQRSSPRRGETYVVKCDPDNELVYW